MMPCSQALNQYTSTSSHGIKIEIRSHLEKMRCTHWLMMMIMSPPSSPLPPSHTSCRTHILTHCDFIRFGEINWKIYECDATENCIIFFYYRKRKWNRNCVEQRRRWKAFICSLPLSRKPIVGRLVIVCLVCWVYDGIVFSLPFCHRRCVCVAYCYVVCVCGILKRQATRAEWKQNGNNSKKKYFVSMKLKVSRAIDVVFILNILCFVPLVSLRHWHKKWY